MSALLCSLPHPSWLWCFVVQYAPRAGVRSVAPLSKEGFLVKRGRFRKNWLARWFVLNGPKLEYYKERNRESSLLGTILLLGTTEIQMKDKECARDGVVSSDTTGACVVHVVSVHVCVCVCRDAGSQHQRCHRP